MTSKNWSHVGNQGAADPAVRMYSLVWTCKAGGVNWGDYFHDVLLKTGTCSDVTNPTPHGWKQPFPFEVEQRQYEALMKLFATP